jgi:hypothetical protein
MMLLEGYLIAHAEWEELEMNRAKAKRKKK